MHVTHLAYTSSGIKFKYWRWHKLVCKVSGKAFRENGNLIKVELKLVSLNFIRSSKNKLWLKFFIAFYKGIWKWWIFIVNIVTATSNRFQRLEEKLPQFHEIILLVKSTITGVEIDAEIKIGKIKSSDLYSAFLTFLFPRLFSHDGKLCDKSVDFSLRSIFSCKCVYTQKKKEISFFFL